MTKIVCKIHSLAIFRTNNLAITHMARLKKVNEYWFMGMGKKCDARLYFHLMKKKINQLTLVPQPNNHDKRFKKNDMITNNQVVNV